ncbi:phage antirepressor KilAC domain-containing protein [Tsukamurella tyrosinosolvens]|uniref:phage antirepressor KilAC domain-containing protein n=1 Tax=Tsukamurella tyrosinosolvens TaxID=57704 RepID=UPI0034633BC8
MTNDISRSGASGGSPFDEIRRVTPEGREWWSARDLQPVSGYEEWRKFESAIDRAKIAAANAGYQVTDHFVGAAKLVENGLPGVERTVADWHLSRFACYLIALNGDPRKPEIAAAQTYFVIRTREAETRPAVNGADITRLELIEIARNAEMERLALKAENEQLAPKAEAFDSFIDATGKYGVGAVAKMLGTSQNKLFRDLRNAGVLISKGSMRNTPYQQYMRYFEVKAREYERNSGEIGCSYTTYVQPAGVAFIQRKLGLPSIDPLPAVAS